MTAGPVSPLEPASWLHAIEQIGYGHALLLLVVLSIGTAFAVQGGKIMHECNGILKTILKYRLDLQRVNEKVAAKQQNLKKALENKKEEKPKNRQLGSRK